MSYFKSTTVKPTVKILEVTTPKMLISSTALTKMKLYVDKCTNEVGWLGTAYKVDKNKQTYYMIDDVFLFDQETHATTTEITPEGLSQFAEELLNQKDGMEIWNNMKVWGHSHVKMGTTPSGQDDHQMDTFAKNGHDWSIRIIANQHGSMRLDLYQYELGIIYSDIPWERAYSPEELEIAKQIEALQKQLSFLNEDKEKTLDLYISEEIKVKVRPKNYGTTYYKGNQINPHQVPLNDDYYDYGYGYKAQRTPANVKKNENVTSITEEKKLNKPMLPLWKTR